MLKTFFFFRMGNGVPTLDIMKLQTVLFLILLSAFHVARGNAIREVDSYELTTRRGGKDGDDGVVAKNPLVVFDPPSLDIGKGDTANFIVSISIAPTWNVKLNLSTDNARIVQFGPKTLNFSAPDLLSNRFECTGLSAGHAAIFIANPPKEFDTEESWIYVSVYRSRVLTIVGDVTGWIYFATWTLSFWPQIIYVFRKKSVIGLSFDYVAMNLTGHLCYCFFNACLYWSANVQEEYADIHPRGLIQVQVNDVAYSIHASIVAIVLVVECLIYERGGQSMSKLVIGILALVIISATVLLILSATAVVTWLTYLYFFSYVKLALTVIKYSPQVYFNYVRKSTEGWSIHNVLLDFTGGVTSILQMFMLAYNYDDWGSIFGDPSKFGLGAFSAMFDVVFMIQHFVIYRHRSDDDEPDETDRISVRLNDEKPVLSNKARLSLGAIEYKQGAAARRRSVVSEKEMRKSEKK